MTTAALSSQELAAYFSRIGFAGEVRRDFATLDTVVRAHVAAIPFENLDVQGGQKVTTDPQAAFAKLVERRRGGWCYEHNGVVGAALAAIGFDVVRLSAGVMRRGHAPRARASGDGIAFVLVRGWQMAGRCGVWQLDQSATATRGRELGSCPLTGQPWTHGRRHVARFGGAGFGRDVL